MAVDALYGVDVMEALQRLEGRVHLLHVEAAVRELRMAGRAGSTGGLAVFFVAGEATESFVDADRSAVVAGVDLAAGIRGMALVAESLTLVGTDLHRARSFIHLRHREAIQRDVILLAAVKERE